MTCVRRTRLLETNMVPFLNVQLNCKPKEKEKPNVFNFSPIAVTSIVSEVPGHSVAQKA